MIKLQNLQNHTSQLKKTLEEKFNIDKKHEDLLQALRRYEVLFWHLSKVFDKMELVLVDFEKRISTLEIEANKCNTTESTLHQPNMLAPSSLVPDLY